ncbi:small GTP-binding protein [Histomonas meleagridis]|uniref:small GTP-binding protein n=1 Tax=Histomonas meleagridis TaxID=135588 RepID=UPI00355A1801|nr:small GTP-binding protein [Histomonas meleagridis]KAH0798310.1 small GTP-binding protein [Histomonas meleagridis]
MSKESPSTTEAKVVIVGQASVGKTCILQRAINGTFSQTSSSTLGGTYFSLNVKNDETTIATLQIWDTAGQERYRGMTPMYYHGASVAILVYSIDSQDSFDDINNWIQSLKQNCNFDSLQLFLVANKKDKVDERVISTESGAELAKSIDAMFSEVSAKTGEGIEDLFTTVGRIVHDKNTPTVTNVDPTPKPKKTHEKKGSNC